MRDKTPSVALAKPVHRFVPRTSAPRSTLAHRQLLAIAPTRCPQCDAAAHATHTGGSPPRAGAHAHAGRTLAERDHPFEVDAGVRLRQSQRRNATPAGRNLR